MLPTQSLLLSLRWEERFAAVRRDISLCALLCLAGLGSLLDGWTAALLVEGGRFGDFSWRLSE
jgi:hypothetical protein